MNDNKTIIIVLAILLVLFFVASLIGMSLLIKRKYFSKKQVIKNTETNIEKPENFELKRNSKVVIEKQENLEFKKNEEIYFKKLQELANLTQEQAHDLYVKEAIKKISSDKKKQIEQFQQKSSEEINEMSAEILINAMERLADTVVKKSAHNVKIDESIKPKLIGREGRNIKLFEDLTGTNLTIDNSSYATVSSFNPIRKELGLILLNRLINSRSIDISKIEKYYEEEKEKFDKNLVELGRMTVEDVLNIGKYIPKSLYFNVGKLNYRTSYSQNILNHSTECAKLAGMIARNLGFDETKAKASAFIHDIGKSQDYEENNDHVTSGYDLAIEHKLKDFLINSIMSHHGNVPITSIYSGITKVVDTLSASRPGSRKMSQEDYIKRVTEIEAIPMEINGVEKAFVVRSGKEVRIMVNQNIEDDKVEEIANFIKKQYENSDICAIRPIDIIVVKEKRVQLTSNSKIS